MKNNENKCSESSSGEHQIDLSSIHATYYHNECMTAIDCVCKYCGESGCIELVRYNTEIQWSSDE